MNSSLFNSSAYQALKISSMLGLIVCSTLLVALNFKFFSKVFKERTVSMWWLFLTVSVIPFLVMLGIFTILFENKSDTKRVILFKGKEPVVDAQEIEGSSITVVAPYQFVKKFIFPEDATK